LALAALANRAPRNRLVVDDHHLHQAAAPPSGRATPSGPSRSSGMRICATHSPSAPGPASKPARSPNCTVRRSRTLASPTPTRPPSLPGATVLMTHSVSSSPSTRASTRIVTAPSCPASPCTTAFSTSGCRIRLGTQARACASRAGTPMARRSGQRVVDRRGAQLRVAQTLIEGEAHDQPQTEAGGDQEARDARDPDRDFVGGKTLPAAPGLDEVAVGPFLAVPLVRQVLAENQRR